MLATEETTTPETAPATKPLLEEHAANEPMRHVPSIGWICDKLDGDVRARLEKLCASIESHPSPDGETEVRGVCRAIDRLADAAKHVRSTAHGPSDALHRVRGALNHALSCLRTVDVTTFGRRAPFHHFERSKSEMLYGHLLVVLDHLARLTTVVRTLDASIDERLLEGLVRLNEPLRTEPIA